MTKSSLKKLRVFLYVLLSVLAAMALRQAAYRTDGVLDRISGILRPGIYLVLFLVWGISIHIRIIQIQVRRYLIVISALIIFWIAVRTIRYSLEKGVWLIRFLWHLYYVPLLMIPLLAVFIALSLGKGENFRLPKWTALFYIPTVLLLMLVLTNDLHQIVFIFPADAVEWMDDYNYGIGYFLVVVWMMLCSVTALVIMLIKCRIPHSRKVLILPFLPVILAMIYGTLWILDSFGIVQLLWLRMLAGDITIVYCLLFSATLESCIQCGLIQSNTGYDELFPVSRLGAQITDAENNVCLASLNAVTLTEEQRRKAGDEAILADKNTLVRSQPIGFGHVLWQEDVSELTEAIDQIEDNCSELAERNRIRRKNLEMKKRILALQEKNRVNDLLQSETERQMDLIERILENYEIETDGSRCGRLLAGAAVIGAYIKRYGNLLLIRERSSSADIRDLSRCFEESFMNLELLGVNCLHTLPTGVPLATSDMLRVYRSFETMTEACLYDLSNVWIHLRNDAGGYLLHMEFVCETDLTQFAQIADFFSAEDKGTYRFSFRMRKGGV